MIDKNQAVIDYLITCPQIQQTPLYFNFIQAKNNNKQFVTITNDKNVHRPYIDGTVLRRYTFVIIDYRSVAYQSIVKQEGYSNENVEEMFEVQDLITWIEEQNELRNFPDFGEDCEVQEIKALTSNPALNGVDTSVSPALAKYSIAMQIEYLDKSKKLWNN